VMAQRYGDCKDKALFLAALLRELGVEAYPALVNTKLRRRLDGFLPSPFLFDHVITQVINGGKTYWIDGTLSDQGGTLATIETPSDERALVVRPDTNALTPILIRPHGSTAVEEIISSSQQKTTLDVTSTYYGRDADDIRATSSSFASVMPFTISGKTAHGRTTRRPWSSFLCLRRRSYARCRWRSAIRATSPND